jgi:hypothetical protein
VAVEADRVRASYPQGAAGVVAMLANPADPAVSIPSL